MEGKGRSGQRKGGEERGVEWTGVEEKKRPCRQLSEAGRQKNDPEGLERVDTRESRVALCCCQ